ncbi:MAG: elongation factor Ts [Bacteroidia bacterium]|nr:elongation factor Ts [Bacteroidia bacterium]
MSTVAISASDVNKLRQQTGAGMMDCKAALTEAGGDFEKAVEILRKKGQKVADKRSDREATEGYVVGKTSADNAKGIIVSLNCETDFVGKNADFVAFAEKVANIAISDFPATKEELLDKQIDGLRIADHITDMVGKIGEKIELGCYEHISAPFVFAYNHPGNKVVSLVGFSKNGVAGIENVAKDVAMQVAAMSPIALDKADVSSEAIEKELEIAKEVLRKEGKPEDKIEMIAKGKLEKFFKESTLLNQEFIKDSKMNVQQYIQSADKELTATAFKRYSLA